MKSATYRGARGVALVITLFFLVIIVITVIALMDSSRTERLSANSHFERLRATNISRLGLEVAVATLQRETADPARNWISQPGALVVPATTANAGGANSAATAKALKELRVTVPLSSGAPSATTTATAPNGLLAPADLNVRTLVDQETPTYLLVNPEAGQPAPEMKLRWIYLRQKPYLTTLPDGSRREEPFDYHEQPDLRDTANPIIGRFAYWVDDESAKVNYNLAWSRSAVNNFPPGHQTKIDLRALRIGARSYFTDEMADALHRAITPDGAYATVSRFFNSPYDARQLGSQVAGLREALNYNRFNLTHLNSDPDTTFYGKPRMMLTTQLKNAVMRDKDGKPLRGPDGKFLARPFLDILKVTDPDNHTSGANDPGLVSSIDSKDPGSGADAGKLNTVIQTLITEYLQRTDWPMVDGTAGSLQAKYYGTYASPARERRLAQLALNIIDYVRSAESELPVVEPLRGIWQGNAFLCDAVNGSIAGREDTFKGLTRALHLTEMGLWVSSRAETTGPNRGRYPAFAFVEVHLPENYGIDSLDLGRPGQRWKVFFNGFGNANFKMRDGRGNTPIEPVIEVWPNRAAPPATSSCGFIWEALNDPSKTVIKAGEYRTFAIETWSVRPPTEVGNRGRFPLRAAITMESSNRRIDVAPLGTPGNGAAPLDYGVATSEASATTFQFPISSVETDDPRVNGVAAAWVPAARSTFGAVNAAQLASVGRPARTVTPEQDTDSNGRVTKTSMRMPYPRGNAANPNGRVRSPGELGLIHSGIEGSSKVASFGVPWRSLHLQPSRQATSTVPDWAFMDLFTVPVDVPRSAAVVFAPNDTSTGGRVNINAKPVPFTLDRRDPLVAVLYGCRRSTASNATLAINDARTIAGNIYDRRRAANGKLYPAGAGALDVYESPGEVAEIAGVADTGEESEELIREIANLITARGNVFSVYTVGQALKQTATGKLIVTSEQRHQAYIERFLDNRGTISQTDDEIRIRTAYFRHLSP